MRSRVLGLAAITLTSALGITGLVARAQTQPAAARTTAPAKPAKVLRTPWGDPDLQGTWDYRTVTPLERARELGTREFYTEEEKKAIEDRAGRRMDTVPEKITPGLNHAQWWTDPGRFVSDGYRTSLIVDPPDGRIPPLTAEGKARQARAPSRNNAVNASWLDRGDQERCITYGLPSASLPTLYNNNIQIVQAPGTAVIVHEMIHEARVVPLDGRPRLNDNVRAWIGDTRGHWEGDTLVVETTNFNGKHSYRGSTTGLHLIERYTRVAEDRLELRLTVSDPTTWEKPWTVLLPMRPTEGELLEYACHEANLSMFNLLEVARDAEKGGAKGQAPSNQGPVDDRQER
ncbi:MAG TPA: hypothetical protein VKA59_22610 [Vicinamibacterales bacterium]|nr:hypothetical protein [Vicinamibacterales bacterium]